MAVLMDELMEIVRSHGLDGEDRREWFQVPAGPASHFPRRVYIRRTRDGCPVREIHLSGFCVGHPAVSSLTSDEANRRHLGRVRGIINARDRGDAEVLDAIDLALAQVSPVPSLPAASEALSTETNKDVPGPELPIIGRNRIVAWMQERLGYGNRSARAWFVGMEEACEDVRELPARIAGGPLEDLDQALTRIGSYPDLLIDSPRLQPTWAPLIRSWLVASSRTASTPSRDDVRKYQRQQWGRSDGDTLLAELLPLPSPSLQVWPYKELGIGTRTEYQKHWIPLRTEFLAELWRRSSTFPRVAIAYGRSYWKHFRKVFQLPDEDGEAVWPADCTWAQGYTVGRDAIVLVRHPVAFGNSNERWEALGHWLRARV